MGSLMAGWDSHIQDPNVVKLKRNNSLTNGEIDSFWRSRKQKEEEHLRHISSLSPSSQNQVFEEAKRYQRSNSLPSTKEEEEDMESRASFVQKNGWWISSNWAFLNEPPVIEGEGPKYKYASQFHVASMPSKTNPQTGVGA